MGKRKVLSVEEKIEILRQLENGVKNVEICRKYDLSSSTVSTLLKNKEKLQKAHNEQKSDCKRLKKCVKEEVDEALIKWFRCQRSANFAISGPILKIQAEKFAKEFGYPDFQCSNGWLDRFKSRYSINFGKMSGEATSVNFEDVKKWLEEKWPIMKSGYAEKDIYNADETGVFYNITPQHTLKFKGEKCFGGKMSKNRLTALVCANMSGCDKKKLLIIGKSKNPRCFKNVKKLPTEYDHSKKAWMTADIFRKFILKWDQELINKNRKILLLLDNCSAHPEISGLKNIRMEFLPPNSTSRLQPMDQGVIRSLKCHYRKQLILILLDKKEKNEPCKNLSILEAIRLLNDAWESVTPKTIQNAYRKAGLNLQETENNENDLELDSEYLWDNDLEINWDEFQTYVTIDDNLITSQMPTEESIIAEVKNSQEGSQNVESESDDEEEMIVTPPSTSQAMEYVEKLQTFLESKGASDEVFRAMSVIRRTVVKERQNKKKQMKLTSFFPSM